MNKFISNIEYLRQYVNGELSPREMFGIERAAQEDEMLMDIIQGLEIEKEQSFTYSQKNIENLIAERASAQVVSLSKSSSRIYWMGIAASLLLFLGIGGYFLTRENPDTNTQIAYLDEEKEKEINQSKADSVDDAEIIPEQNRNEKTKILAHKTNSQLEIVTKENLDSKRTLDLPPPEQKVILDSKLKENALETQIDEVLIVDYLAGRKDTISPQILANHNASARVGSQPRNSEAKMRADLMRMNLDPQTIAVLNRALDKQSLENSIVNPQGITKQDVNMDSSNSHVLASAKKNMSGVTAEIAASPPIHIQSEKINSPLLGMDKYQSYFKDEIRKIGVHSYNFLVEFEINNLGKPHSIKILESSNENLNSRITKLIQNGPLWNKIDDKKVLLTISN